MAKDPNEKTGRRRRPTRAQNTQHLFERREVKDRNRAEARSPAGIARRAALEAQYKDLPTRTVERTTPISREVSYTAALRARQEGEWRELCSTLHSLLDGYAVRLSLRDEDELRGMLFRRPSDLTEALRRGEQFKRQLRGY